MQLIRFFLQRINESLCGFRTHIFANLFYLITTLTSLFRSQIGHSRSLLLPLVLQSRTDSRGVPTRSPLSYGLLKATSLVVLDVSYSKVYIVCFIELVAPKTYPLIKEEKRFNFKKNILY